MGKINYFDANFKNAPTGGFHGGELIEGNVVIDVVESVSVRSIFIVFFGETHTFWVNKTSDKIYESRERYFNARIDLAGSEEGDHLAQGTHAIPFTYQLPANIPSTFEGEYGYTRYLCTVRIELFTPTCFMGAGATTEFQVDKPFHVSPYVSQSLRSVNPEPVRQQESVDIVGCLGRRGYVQAELLLPKSEYRIGEHLQATVTVNNLSKNTTKGIEMLLFQNTRFQAISRYENVADYKEMNRVIESVSLGSLGPGKKASWPVQMLIPACPPSQVGHIIGIAYWAKLICKEGIEITCPVGITSQGVHSAPQHHGGGGYAAMQM